MGLDGQLYEGKAIMSVGGQNEALETPPRIAHFPGTLCHLHRGPSQEVGPVRGSQPKRGRGQRGPL